MGESGNTYMVLAIKCEGKKHLKDWLEDHYEVHSKEIGLYNV